MSIWCGKKVRIVNPKSKYVGFIGTVSYTSKCNLHVVLKKDTYEWFSLSEVEIIK